MSSFRPILPLPQSADNASDVASRDERAASISAASTSASSDSGTQLLKKRKAVSQACLACRRAKAKVCCVLCHLTVERHELMVEECDGARPICQTCINKERECVYECKEGELRVSALRSRIRVLEEQIGRSELGEADSEEPSEAQSGLLLPPETPTPGASRHESPGSIYRESLPSISVTQQAVDGFFRCSGMLFNVFSRLQVSHFVNSVHASAGESEQSREADICCLMAVAGAGALYADTIEADTFPDKFYSIAKQKFDAVLERRPLDGIKVCALFCLYNLLDKAVAAVAYADIGLGLCRRFGLHSEHRELLGLTDLAWVDYRKTWRTLIFLSAWLSSTLGYESGNLDLLQRTLPLKLNIDSNSDISEVIQTEITRIAVLKVNILHMHTTHEDLDQGMDAMSRDLEKWYEGLPPVMHLQEVSAETSPLDIRRSICVVHLLYLGANMLLFRRVAFQAMKSTNIHGGIPSRWQPSREQYLKQADSATLAANSSAKIIKLMIDEGCVFKRCWIIIFQSYTSCLVLLHAVIRKIALHAEPFTYEGDLEYFRCCMDALLYCASVDSVAARFHATVLSMYNSLMHSHVNQGPLTKDPDVNPEVEQFRTVSEASAADTVIGIAPQETLIPSNPTHGDLFQHVDSSLEKLSNNLLTTLCRPFGDPTSPNFYRGNLDEVYETTAWQPHDESYKETVEWDHGNPSSFQWDTEKLGISNDRISQLSGYFVSGESSKLDDPLATPIQNQFMDSSEPSGWASAEHLRATSESP